MESMIRTVDNIAVVNALQGAAFYLAVEHAEKKFVCVSQSVDVVAKQIIDALAFTVFVVKSIKHEVEKSSLEKL